jgi:hypothetical protein
MTNRMLQLSSILFLLSCGEKAKPVTPDPATISISSIAVFEGDTPNSKVTFKVNLSRATDQTVSVDYLTTDGTAGAGTDYVSKSGTLEFKPQVTEATIELNIVGDTLKEADETFNVILSKPINAFLTTSTGVATIRNDDTYIFIPADGYITPDNYTGYEKTWQDEFSGTSLDLTSWGFDVGGGGWGNNELQYYTENRPENVFLNNGNLVIQAKKESFSGREYTSSRLITKNKRTFTFGRVDIRAKLPKGKGVWPALWMLGTKIDQVSWPNCGEIDIMEVIGSIPNRVHGTVHYGPQGAGSTQKTGTYTLPTGDFSDKFHVFSLNWTADNMEFLMDDIVYFRTNRSQVGSIYPFNEPFFFIFNVAVGGNWPGAPDATTVFPQQMVVDYVRVFKKL